MGHRRDVQDGDIWACAACCAGGRTELASDGAGMRKARKVSRNVLTWWWPKETRSRSWLPAVWHSIRSKMRPAIRMPAKPSLDPAVRILAIFQRWFTRNSPRRNNSQKSAPYFQGRGTPGQFECRNLQDYVQVRCVNLIPHPCPTRWALRRMADQGSRFRRYVTYEKLNCESQMACLNLKSVPDSWNRYNDLRVLGRSFQLLTQTRNMHIHSTCEHGRMMPPYLL